MRALSVIFAATVLSAPWAPAAAQDQDYFGAGVAISGSDLLVVKPAAARGPAAIYVMRRGPDGWMPAQHLITDGARASGQPLGGAIVVTPSGVVVGGADPDGRIGAHHWYRDGDGAWTPAGALLLQDDVPAQPTVTLASVMRVLSPARRAVAVHGDYALVASGGTARLFRRDTRAWAPVTTLQPDSAPDNYGFAVALEGGSAFVSAPGDSSSMVFRFAPEPDGAWAVRDTLVGASGGGRFGAALALDGGRLAVGAPTDSGGGTVTLYQQRDGAWTEVARLHNPDTATAGFGSVLALAGDELLVGQPQRGRVYRFARRGDRWDAAGTLTADEVGERSAFGAALAIGRDFIAVGAPNADGARGRVAVYPRGAGGFLLPVEWVRMTSGPETSVGGEIRCRDGRAGPFACDAVDLEAFLTIADLGGEQGERVSDLWGWNDPETGREIVLIGRTGGLVFVDVTAPARPLVLGWMPANRSGARDIKVYDNHAFMTGDGAGRHGLQVFDLTRLRSVTAPPAVFEPDAVYDSIASAHNLVIDTVAGFAYPVAASGGGETCGGGLHMVDIRDPKVPVFAGCYTDTEGLLAPGRTHDAQCVTYHGPDAEHRGRQICFASNETALRIVDVTDKANPVPLAAGRYPGTAYIHQGWLTEDQRYFYLDDELDELVGITDRTRTMIWDVTDLDDPVMIGEYFGPEPSTDHNLYVRGNRMYQANYQAGLRVVDISDPEHPVEIGFFDTTPYDGNPAGFYGAWTAFPYFRSGTVAVSSMQEGLFILRPREAAPVP